MNALKKLATGTAIAFALTGATVLWPGAAMADSDRTDCTGNDCVRLHCYDDGWCQRTAEFDRRDYRDYDPAGYAPAGKRLRYACDADGDNCHMTRHYYYDDYGRAVYDPDAAPY